MRMLQQNKQRKQHRKQAQKGSF
ncbi:hypothetical protein CGLO_10679 [Colletotrichum gloeosporioides Cg-14]|uniref:Uncharacterized protein n=1 Tax=Colletotrichum gloeosporioides (strain Cg-14) TaxID=1237896 RepID=T0LP36_COLGC|nr:hypothetical protein CGLO_10679 [Colletotrichum gloeosporioides Cg-14]